MALPVIDLAGDKHGVAKAIHDVCTKFGFMYVSNHGVPQKTIDNMYEQSRKFFSLPLEEKLKILADKKTGKGYTLLAEETLDPENQTQGDTKEGLYFGRDEITPESEECKKPLHGPNLWPSEELLPGFRAAMVEYFQAVEGLGSRLVQLLALSLGMEESFFDAAFHQSMAALRPLHYAAVKSEPTEGKYGCGAHTDYGMLTILWTDNVPGLQLYLGDEWVDMTPIPGTFVINLGDMLERWTNGLYRSTRHRVVNYTGQERYSTPFFYEPNFHTLVECLPMCCADAAPKYPPTTAGQHLMDKYAATHAGFDGYKGPTYVDQKA